MSRGLAPWAGRSKPRKPNLLGGFLDAWKLTKGALRCARPENAPPIRRNGRAFARSLTPLGAIPWKLRRQLILSVRGHKELIGLTKPVIVVANHPSVLDQAILLGLLPRRWQVRAGDPERLLAKHKSVIIFPEGETSKRGDLQRFSSLAASLAIQHSVPIVPVAIRGTFSLVPILRIRSLSDKPRVTVRFGQPIHPHRVQVDELTHSLRDAILNLLAVDELTWWETLSQRPRAGIVTEPVAPWRRIWQQTKPIEQRKTIWTR
ncbi:MAG: hypothetical protein CR980_00550 [Propionibacteriales bacterium]|nr:MAG: hypothetical protein CR980_00550 [Propionibacteriales bacterium]